MNPNRSGGQDHVGSRLPFGPSGTPPAVGQGSLATPVLRAGRLVVAVRDVSAVPPRSLYSTLGATQTGCVRLSLQDVRDLGWWAALTTHTGLGRALWPPALSHTMHTDASLSGWGAVLDNAMPARELHVPPYRGAHINLLELVTVRLGLQSSRRFQSLRYTWLLLKSDSTVTMGAVNAMSSKSPVIIEELRRLHALCHTWAIHIRAEHLPSAFKAYADRLSREGDSTDWTLSAMAFRDLELCFGPNTVDWFASAKNA